MAKKKVAARKALPTEWNLPQLDEELRVALGAAQRYGLTRLGAGTPQIVAARRERTLRARRGVPARTITEDVPWTQAQLDTIAATLAAHVADPLWAEKQDDRAIRLILTDADFTAVIALDPATLNLQQKVTRKLAQAVRALARMERGEAQ